MNLFKGKERLDKILNKRLIKVSPNIKKLFPAVLSTKKVSYFPFLTEKYFLLDFIDSEEKRRIEQLTRRGFHPFPGLIKENETIPIGTAFRLENSRNTYIDNCNVNNIFSLSLGQDTTSILSNHTQSIQTDELGIYKYILKLAYIVSFGLQINRGNMLDFIEDLIAYSIDHWVSINEK
jgi:hypothetical protein